MLEFGGCRLPNLLMEIIMCLQLHIISLNSGCCQQKCILIDGGYYFTDLVFITVS